MFDKRDGLYKLLDVNTRAWGWIAMCTYAGVDFPYLMWKLVQGDNIENVRAQAGIHWVRTLYDLEAAIPGIRTGSISMRDYLSSLKGAKHEMYEADDLKPALVELWRFTKRALRKMKKLTFGRIRHTQR
jgi:D-aspartate ligase